MTEVRGRRIVIAAVGSEYRRDDGAGPAVLGRLRGALEGVEVLGTLASPLDLVEAWDGAGLAIVVDAVAGGAQPGELHVVEVEQDATPAARLLSGPRPSSHGLGVMEALRLAHVLGSAPDRVVIVGIGGEDFGQGVGLSPAVAGAVEPAALLVTGLAAAVASAQHQGSGCAATPTMGSPAMARCSTGSTTGARNEA